MPVINRAEYNHAEAKQGGSGFAQMEPGVYELRIQAIRTRWTKKDGSVTDGIANKCVRIVWDVASGPFEGKYTEAYFVDWEGKPDPDKDFMHSDMLSWKNMDYFKGKMVSLTESNTAFDALAAFEGIPDEEARDPQRWGMFVGKRFWAVIGGTVSLNDNGYDRWTLDVQAWITPEQARTGEHPEPKVEDKRKKGAKAAPAIAHPGGASYAV